MGKKEGCFEFRIAKLGTRPKGGSPQDNFEIKQQLATDPRRQTQTRNEFHGFTLENKGIA